VIGQDNFLELSIDEVVNKLQILANNKEVVKVWAKGEESSFYRLCDILFLNNNDKYELLLSFFSEGEDQDATLVGKRAYISFHFNDVDYFAEGLMIHDQSNDKMVLKLEGSVYRSEKRDNERLITFPHYQVYAYFKIITKSEENVLPFKKSDELPNYKEKQKEDLKKKLSEKVKSIDDLVGFRTLDISRNGIAFVVNTNEEKHFKEDKKVSFYILFNNEIFLVKGAKLVYKVDYLNSGEEKNTYKVGLTYNPVPELTKHLSDLLYQSSQTDLGQKEFEDFINK
jgi:hypothetical protein